VKKGGHLAIEHNISSNNEQLALSYNNEKQTVTQPASNNSNSKIKFVDESDKDIHATIDKAKTLADTTALFSTLSSKKNTSSGSPSQTASANSIRQLDLDDASSDNDEDDEAEENNMEQGGGVHQNTDFFKSQNQKHHADEVEDIIKLSSSSSSVSTSDAGAAHKTQSTNLEDLLGIDFNTSVNQQPVNLIDSFNLISIAAPQPAPRSSIHATTNPFSSSPSTPVQEQPPPPAVNSLDSFINNAAASLTPSTSTSESMSFQQKINLFQSNLPSSSHAVLPPPPPPPPLRPVVFRPTSSIYNSLQAKQPLSQLSNNKASSKPDATYESILNEFDPFADQTTPSNNTDNIRPQLLAHSHTVQAISNNRSGMIAPPPLLSSSSSSSQPVSANVSPRSVPRPSYSNGLSKAPPPPPPPPPPPQNPVYAANTGTFYNHFAPQPFHPSMSHPNLSSVYRPVQFNFGGAQQQQVTSSGGGSSQFLASTFMSTGAALSNSVNQQQQKQEDAFDPNDLL
jgi:hypothetical protein